MKDYKRTAEEAAMAFHQGNRRLSADKYIEAFQIAPSKWSDNRWHIWHGYTSILCEKYFEPSPRDLENLTRIMNDKHEPILYRSEAAWRLGLLAWDRHDRQEAASLYRRAIQLMERATEKERRRQVTAGSSSGLGLHTVGSVIDQNMEQVRDNLAVLENPFGSSAVPQPILRSDGTLMEPDVRTTIVPFADLDPERLAVGGDKCDGCRKTLKELGKKKLHRCARCERAYYCSEVCQRRCWEAGHKKACRKPGQIKAGDYMRLRGLEKRPELNGLVVKVVKEIDGRWQVMVHDENKTLSVKADNLEHVRPAK